MVIHIEELQKGRKGQPFDTSQENQHQQHQQLFKTVQATNIINNSRVSPLASRHYHQIRTKNMEVDACYESQLVDGSCAQMDHGSPGGMTRRTIGRRRKQRSQRQGRPRSINVTDFEQANEFLHHFHAITSRSLDVIHECMDLDDADESNIALMDRDTQSPSHGLSAMRRTKTCSCLLEAQTSATIGNHHGWFIENSNDDDEWGFYSEEFDPSWSTSTRTVNQGIAPLRH